MMENYLKLLTSLTALALQLAAAYRKDWRLAVVTGIALPASAFALHLLFLHSEQVGIDTLSASIERELSDGEPRTREDLERALAIEGDQPSFDRALADRVRTREVLHKVIPMRDEYNRIFQARVYFREPQ